MVSVVSVIPNSVSMPQNWAILEENCKLKETDILISLRKLISNANNLTMSEQAVSRNSSALALRLHHGNPDIGIQYTTDCCLSEIIWHGNMSSCFHLEHHCRYYMIKQVWIYFIKNVCSYQVKSQCFHRLAAQKRGITVLITELMFNEPQNHPGLFPMWWTEFPSSFVTKPSLCYLCPKIEITKQRQFDHKDKSANLGVYHVKAVLLSTEGHHHTGDSPP